MQWSSFFDSLNIGVALFTTRHKVVHDGGSPNFNWMLFDKKTNYLAQILQSISYKMCSIILPKFNTFGLFIPILGASAVMDQTACCYNVTTSETGLYVFMTRPVQLYINILKMKFCSEFRPILLVPSLFSRLSSVFGRLQNPVLLVLSSKNGSFRRPS